MVYPEINLWQEWCISVKEHVTVYQIWPQALCLGGHQRTCMLPLRPSFRQCILVPWPPSCDRHDKNGDCFYTLCAVSALTAAWSFAKLSGSVGIFINKALGFDSNLCREALEDGQKMSSFPCRGKRSPWLCFSTLKFLLTKRQPGAQLWHQPSQSPALSKRIQESISFLHGLQECVPGASWVIQGGFYFTRVEPWG